MGSSNFRETSTLEKVLFRMSTLTFSTIVGNIYLILMLVCNGHPHLLPKFWITLNIIFVVILGRFLTYNMKISHRNLLVAGAFLFLLLPIFWSILPLKIPQKYVGLRKQDAEGYVISDEYCPNDCAQVSFLKGKGYQVERQYYSWRYAELLIR